MAVCLVTGANRGIGFEVCRQLAQRGDTVVATARSLAKAEAAAAELASDGEVHALKLDVTDAESIVAAVAEVGERFGRLDVLINNAAINYDTWQRVESADLAVVRETMETNLYGPWQLIHGFLPLLHDSAHPRIVNVSSESGSLASMGAITPAYSLSKVGLNALTRMMADALRPEGILVNSVCPGWVATDMGGAGGGPVAEGAASVIWAATVDDDGPTGGFFRHGKPVPW